MNLKLQNPDHVKILAKEAAQREHRNQVVYETIENGYRIFRFLPEGKYSGVEFCTVRYTKEAERGNILSNNGNWESGPVKSESTGSGKRRKAK